MSLDLYINLGLMLDHRTLLYATGPSSSEVSTSIGNSSPEFQMEIFFHSYLERPEIEPWTFYRHWMFSTTELQPFPAITIDVVTNDCHCTAYNGARMGLWGSGLAAWHPKIHLGGSAKNLLPQLCLFCHPVI